ncbi:hypothetical protein A6V39_02735 [Candidatus Mycoplasma haematobovis]|uniref:DUF31 domain-containing protein n=1 Tax=Candidatus Mycoplasma haematobovis TaxID=432608 RepID=A0A1A9QF58_9MOLU|nr:hypothetical protein [Candidatus Mycoplasma haematobovis]OAL10330.1 hypothetical protein A6V39_02735 [Candidatus Mycoplasma haematobovis]
MAVSFKTGGALILTASTAIFAFKQLATDADLVVDSSNSRQIENTSDVYSSEPDPSNEIEDEISWESEEIIDESRKTVGLGDSDNGSPWPTKYKYLSNNNRHDFLLKPYSEQEKKVKRAEAERIYETLNDFTFKFFMPCGFGTGWILDYEIPKDPNKYPTKWYIATNAHVIWRINFEDNPYKQKLTKDKSWTEHLRTKYKEEYEKVKNYSGPVRDKCKAVDKFGYVDFNISQGRTGIARKADVGGVVQKQINAPKLFYGAFNFLNPEVAANHQIPKNHFADFAVLEIEFTDPTVAKVATNDFVSKYKNKPDAINVLGKPIEEKYEKKEDLWAARDNYYIFGYPIMVGTDKWVPTANFNNNTAIASHLFDWEYGPEEKAKRYKGFVDVKDSGGYYHGSSRQKFNWNGEYYYEFGHRYKFRENPLAPGSSGAMYVDGEGTAVGMIVRTSGNKYGDNGNGGSSSWAQPFRSNGTVEVNGVKTPKYDLISGVEGQIGSYKQQVEEYILNQGRSTWLSEKAGWKPTKAVS